MRICAIIPVYNNAGTIEDVVRRTAARTLCNPSLRTASGPEGSSAK